MTNTSYMFTNVAKLLAVCEKTGKKIHEIMIEQEHIVSGKREGDIVAEMERNLCVMKSSIEAGKKGVISHSGMTGGDGKKLYEYIENGKYLTDITTLKAICYAVSINEVNAAMGIICATPTAGSAGIVPGVLIALKEKYELSDSVVVKHLFTAGAFGYIIANNASISGAAGGCQAEVGSASGMAAAAAVEMMGGTAKQSAHAMAIALKNMLGLSCDPVAGLVEVPCIKRNAAGSSNALTAAEMALAGVESVIPPDEVIDAMNRIGLAMPFSLKETALGGLATTDTGKKWKEKL